jgi:hypothetical protein
MTIRTIILSALLASSAIAAPKAPKAHLDYLVCTVEAGKVHVWEIETTAPKALATAKLLDRTHANGNAPHLVIVSDSAEYEAPKTRTEAQCAKLAPATDSYDALNDPKWMAACEAGKVLP